MSLCFELKFSFHVSKIQMKISRSKSINQLITFIGIQDLNPVGTAFSLSCDQNNLPKLLSLGKTFLGKTKEGFIPLTVLHYKTYPNFDMIQF